LLDVADNKLRVRTAQTPASATAAGNQGEIAWDASFVYVCINTNTWRPVALSAW
jgi:acyl-CoA thioesterase FadM